MTRRKLVVWLIIGAIFAGQGPLLGQSAVSPAIVNEAKVIAVLGTDSIRLQLPLENPAGTGVHAVAWVMSPSNIRSGETSVDLAEGIHAASFTLPWPKNEKNKPITEIGWYRIAYRVEAINATPVYGVLSIGAIATNLLTLRMALPDRLIAGKPLTVRIYAGNPVTKKAFRGVHLQATLKYDGEPDEGAKPFSRMVVREATTAGSGEADLTYPIQGAPGDTATLTVKGTFASTDGTRITASVDADVEISDRTSIHVETDKPLHKPGEPVHLRALIFDDAGRAAASTAVTLTIKDPENKTLLEESLTTNRFGIATYDWKTRTPLTPGDYYASFDLDDSSDYSGSASTMISIRRYELPEFAVSASMDHGFYLDGQKPIVHLHAGYLFGKPVSAGTVRIIHAENRGYWPTKKRSEPVEQNTTLDEHGDADLQLNVKDDFEEFNGNDYERYRDIEYRTIVTDPTTGRTEPRNFTARLTRYPVHIYLYGLGGNDHEGDYIVSTTYADGEPVICKVAVDWMDAASHPSRAVSVSTNRYGLAKVHLRYPAASLDNTQSGYGLRVTARDPEGRTSLFDETVSTNNAKNIWFSVAESLLKPGQSIAATLHGQPGSIVDVDVYSEQGLLAHQRVRMMRSSEPLEIPATDSFHGLVTLQAYRLNADVEHYNYGQYGASSSKSVLYPEDRELKLKLTGLRTSYAPGAEVMAGLDLRGARGFAAPGALGVSIFDTAVEQRAATEEKANDRWFGTSWWQDSSGVAGVSRPSLDKTDMARPVSEDLQLAAEAVLLSNSVRRIKLEYDDYDDVRSEYSSTMQKSLKPVGEAILASRPARIPATIDATQTAVNNAGLDNSLLLDPWGTHYKVQTSVEWNDELLRMISAGPDKLFGTEDDFTIDVARRNLFSLPGERLTNLLRDAVAAGRPLPGTLNSLKEFTRAAGLDLDATFDLGGKPFLYEIEVGRRFYKVDVFRHDTAAQPDGHLSGEAVWTSPSVDYFSLTESRLEGAIGRWVSAGKPFPETEAEALQAFSAAGIDFDSLRDPLGQHFQLHIAQVMAYTRFENVTAGASLQMTSRPVTHLFRAIQVRRPAKPGADDAALEVVAQFLHPITEQSGSDLKPEAIDRGTFKGNTGAIGGTVTDQTGAIIAGASLTVKTGDGVTVATVQSMANGIYLVPDLNRGFYTVEVAAPGFTSFVVTEISVSSATLTSVDVTLRVGTAAETVTVNAQAIGLQTTSASVALTSPGIVGTSRKSVGRGGEQATISEPTFTPRLRHVFEETAFWSPSLETTANGRASLHFNLPDSLTTWKLHALASTVDGRIGVLDQTFKTFQPFFVDLDAPQVLTVGDEITLPVNLRNYTGRTLTMPVVAKHADWFTLLTPSTVPTSVPSNGSTPVVFGLRANSAVEAGPLRLTAANAHDGDAVERSVHVHPDGEPRAIITSGLLTHGLTTLTLDLPADTITGSVHSQLLLYPNLGAHVLHAMKAVLERPYGCGEQTISSTYPSLLYLELLKAGRPGDATADSPIKGEAQTYLQLGYDRLMDYFDANGGLTYWGRNDHTADPALTAYGIEFLTESDPYITVDRSRIIGAVNWLLANQQPEGGWKPRYGQPTAQVKLYITAVLEQIASNAPGNALSPELKTCVQRAAERATARAATSAAAVHAPYANALGLRLAIQAGDPAAVARLRTELAAIAVHGSTGAHWVPLDSLPFYGWGHAGEMETTALVLAALRQGSHSPADDALINEALFFLLSGQDRYGVWYSGQATVRVLQALLPLAIEQMKAPSASQEFRLAINGVPLTGSEAKALRIDPRLIAAPRSVDLTMFLKAGHNELAFTGASDASLASVEATASFYIPWHGEVTSSTTQTGKDAGLDFSYNCAATNAHVGAPIDCTVKARRFGSSSYGMLLAEVGLPPGADVDRASLARLLDNWTISRYELQPDRIVFYLWSSLAEGSHFNFRFTPRYAIHAKAAPATLSDYYNPDLKAVLPPETFSVTNQLQK
jgi:Alpha-2-macroglobulin family/A-macroglobulin TED domain/MG2 domain/Carboxypeptidase regulatory-like domain/A-macroglobulin receptor binding domain